MRTLVASETSEPGLNKRLAEWAADRIWPEGGGFGPCATMAVCDGQRLVAVVVYHNYDPSSQVVELSAAATTPKWFARNVLQRMYDTAFTGLDCQLAVIRVSEKNESLTRNLHTLGMTCYRIPRLRGRGEDDLIFTLTDDAWMNSRFNMNRSSHGQEVPEAA